MTGIRMDAWLWAARFFKTRTLAKKSCDLGRILSNGQAAKAAREVRVGDMLRITNDGGRVRGRGAGTERCARAGFGGAEAVSGDGSQQRDAGESRGGAAGCAGV